MLRKLSMTPSLIEKAQIQPLRKMPADRITIEAGAP